MSDTVFEDQQTKIEAAWLNDISRSVYQGKNPSFTTSTGTANDYTVNIEDSALTSVADGQQISFEVNATNTGATNLTLIGNSNLGTYPIYAGAAPLTGGELISGQVVTVVYNNGIWNAVGTLNRSLITNAIKLSPEAAASLGVGNSLQNGYMIASVSGNAITISIKTLAGADPSSTDPVSLTLRSSSLTSGTVTGYGITSALSTVISDGSTLGTVATETVRIHVGILENGSGSLELFYWVSASQASSYVYCPDPTEYVTTIAEGGAGGADSAQVLYSTTARTNRPWKYLGYFELQTGTPAGTWNASPTKVVNYSSGMPMPGDIVQVVRTDTGSVAPGTTLMGASSRPTITEGTQFLSQSITKRNGLNWLHPIVKAYISPSYTTGAIQYAMFETTNSNALVAGNTSPRETTVAIFTATLDCYVKAPFLFPVTFTFRAGPGSAATVTFNGAGGVVSFGGAFNSYIMVEEIHI